MNKIKNFFINIAVFIYLFLIDSQVAFARAGGGHGGGHGGSHGGSHGGHIYGLSNFGSWVVFAVIIIFLIVLIVVEPIIKLIIDSKNKKIQDKNKNKIDTLRYKGKEYWDYNEINNRIRIVYYKYQRAWYKRDTLVMRDFLESEYLKGIEKKVSRMRKRKKINVLKNIKYNKGIPILVHSSNGKDYLWMKIYGSMIDYIVKEKDLKTYKKKYFTSKSFCEYWKFEYINGKWMLSQIKQHRIGII